MFRNLASALAGRVAAGQGAGMPHLDPATLADPAWLAHRYDRPRDVFVLRRFPRAGHAAVPFLTDEYLGPTPGEPHWVERSCVSAIPGAEAPLHFIFHSAFCNSTLLTRALDVAGLAMGLSEPVVLNDLVGLRRRGELDAAALAQRSDAALRLLGRPWGVGEGVVVKPSNTVNGLAAGLLTLRPGARAVLVHTRLPLFLASVARKGLWGRLWVRELAEGLARDGLLDPVGITGAELGRMTDLQVAAAGWLAQHRLFAELARRFGAGRVRSLEAESLNPAPGAVLDRLADHLALSPDPDLRTTLREARALTRHSKTGAPFDMAERRREQDSAQAAHGDEIAAVSTWAEAVAQNAGIAMELPFPL